MTQTTQGQPFLFFSQMLSWNEKESVGCWKSIQSLSQLTSGHWPPWCAEVGAHIGRAWGCWRSLVFPVMVCSPPRPTLTPLRGTSSPHSGEPHQWEEARFTPHDRCPLVNVRRCQSPGSPHSQPTASSPGLGSSICWNHFVICRVEWKLGNKIYRPRKDA